MSSGVELQPVWPHEGMCGELTVICGPRRGSSIYRGVRWHERNGKWEARIFDSASGKQVRPALPDWLFLTSCGCMQH